MPELFDYTFTKLQNRLLVRGDLVARTGQRIGAGRMSDVVGSDLPVLRDAKDRPFIPGASIKGALRARAEALIRAVAANPDEAAPDLEQIEQRTRELRSNKEQYRWSDSQFETAIWQGTTLIDLTFGSPEIAGRLFIKDALVSAWSEQFEVRNGVALNRDTETVEQGLLYDYEVVPAGTRFDFELVLENADKWQLGMVLLLLKPWERGEAQIGGFRSRGLGYVQLDVTERRFVAVRNDVERLLDLLRSGTTGQISETDENSWYEAFRDELRRLAQREG
jgi:CRISPR-associated RAMP protein (TIGR02581 family)